MDVIALHQADIKNTVATLGTAVTQENLLQCFKYTKEIICCFDGDQAGKKAAWQGVENIMPIIKDGDVISFVFLPEGKDPDNIVNKGGKNHWNELVNKKISLEDFIYNKFSSESDINTAAGKTLYIQKVDKLLDNLNAKILKSIISNSLKEKVGAKYIIDNKGNEIIQKRKITKSASPLQKAILILMHNPNIEVDESIVNDSRIEKNQGIIILKSIIKLIKNDNNINMGRILEKFRHESDHYKILEQISRISITNYEFPGKEFHACICLTIKNYLKEKLQESDPSDIKKSAKIQQEIREIDDKSKKF
jgi:DNA primase